MLTKVEQLISYSNLLRSQPKFPLRWPIFWIGIEKSWRDWSIISFACGSWLCMYVPPVAHGPDYCNAMPGPPGAVIVIVIFKQLRTQPLQRLMMEFLSANLDREIDLGKEGETMPQMSFEQLRQQFCDGWKKMLFRPSLRPPSRPARFLLCFYHENHYG